MHRFTVRFRRIIALPSALALVLAAASCGNFAETGKYEVYAVATSTLVNVPGLNLGSASCPGDEQMVGGYYSFKRSYLFPGETPIVTPPSNSSSDSRVPPIVVEWSYPSNLNTWTVLYFNPDSDSNGPHFDELLETGVYCFKPVDASTPRLDLKMHIAISAPLNIQPNPPASDPGSAKAHCSSNDTPTDTATAGGFRIMKSSAPGDTPVTPYTVLSNATIAASTPLILTQTKRVVGWEVIANQWDESTTTRAYALCSPILGTEPMGKTVSPDAQQNSVSVQNGCVSSQDWATGGGYTIDLSSVAPFHAKYIVTLPQSIYDDETVTGFSGWHIGADLTYAHVEATSVCVQPPA
jgi:hypothetical protein